MRALILIAGAALALAACGKNDQAGNTANIDEVLAAENVASNDVTAIDAVTGEDSNMAADVALLNEGDNASAPTGNASSPKTKPAAAKPAPETTPPASNSTEAATTNNVL
jgi:hypothetical protein